MQMALIIFMQVICFMLCTCAEAENIINGKEVQPHCMPYMTFVKIISPVKKLSRCGGMLIRDDYVLTAAHCAQGKMSVILGVRDIMAANQFRQEIEVCNAIKHPKYNPNALEHDIMLLKLTKKAVLSRYVLPLPIEQQSNSSVTPGSVCTVAGWGQYNVFNDKLSPLLREVNLTVVSTKTCSTFYPKIAVENFICAGEEEEKNTGQGDSGSPLFCGQYLSGIVLGGQKFRQPPSLFTKVSSYRYWMKTTMEKKKCKNYT